MMDGDSESLGPRGADCASSASDKDLGPRGYRSESSDSGSDLGPKGEPLQGSARPAPARHPGHELVPAMPPLVAPRDAMDLSLLAVVPAPELGPLALAVRPTDVWAGRQLMPTDLTPTQVESQSAAIALADILRPNDDMQRCLLEALRSDESKSRYDTVNADIDQVAEYACGEIPRPVCNQTAEARLVGVTVDALKRHMKELAAGSFQCCVLLVEAFLLFICHLIGTGHYEGISSLEIMHNDETTMVCRVKEASRNAYGTEPGEECALVQVGKDKVSATGRRHKYATVSAKIMAVFLNLSVVVKHVPTGRLLHFRCVTPRRYYNIDKNTGESTHESLVRTRRPYPRMADVHKRCLENGVRMGNDRALQNQRADKGFRAVAPPKMRVLRLHCYMHCTQQTQGYQLDSNKRLISGITNTGCSYTCPGAVELARGALRMLIRCRLRRHRGVAPPGPGSPEYKHTTEILDTFIPLAEYGDIGLRRRWVIRRLDNGALWTEWWDHYCIDDCCEGGRRAARHWMSSWTCSWTHTSRSAALSSRKASG